MERTKALGVPNAGVTKVGDVFITNVVPVPVCEAIEVAFPEDVIGPVRLAFVVTVPAVRPAAVPVILVPTKALGVPNAGVTKVGELARTTDPEPVVAAADAAVTSPFPLTVTVEIAKEPTFVLTVANVEAEEPGPEAVISPVNAVI